MSRLAVVVALLLIARAATARAGDGPISFTRDVRPILADRCFSCHGFDDKSREAELRLDARESAIAIRADRPAIAPGRPDESELMRRVTATNLDERMPPPDSKKALTDAEIAVLRRWIQEGAAYEKHWSLEPARTKPIPSVRDTSWPRNEIDRFVLARLEEKGLRPAHEARPEQLLRRVTQDLTGLPPTLEELDSFLADPSPAAYEKAVDRLLASPAFGEHMAVPWLDLARYADTNGYFGDKTRSAWLWRDWVIDAFNRNMPFDQFTIEQLAGDLLPDPTIEQRIATGFNRNHMANNETGIIDEEFRVEYVADRLETTATTWLSLTVGCARCHDHKYDPISQKDYYQLFAFFNNGPESGLITTDNPPPTIEVPSPEQRRELAERTATRDQAEQEFKRLHEPLKKEIEKWELVAANELGDPPSEKQKLFVNFDEPIPGREVGTTIQRERGVIGQAARFDATQHIDVDADFDLESSWTIATWFNADNSLSCLLSKIEPVGNRRGFEVLWQKGRLKLNLVSIWGLNAIEVTTAQPTTSRALHHLVVSYDGSKKAAGLRVFLDGKPVAIEVERDALSGPLQNAEPVRIGRRDSGLGFYGTLDELRFLQTIVSPQEVERWFWSERVRGILQRKPDARVSHDQDSLLEYFLDRHAEPVVRDAWLKAKKLRKAVNELRAAIPTALVMQDMTEPRVTSVLERGQYDQPRERVQPDVPSILPPFPEGAPHNRLGLARWLVRPDHPLTARVAVNRLWQQCFGEGLVRTVSDFGLQGELPSHPELLDWLAFRFVDDGWDMKRLLKTVVMSATYRQASARTSADGGDPENRLLARGPSFRLSAEAIRDQALFVSGLLVPQVGGRSARPYQPPGLWEAVSYNGEETYVPDQGAGLWRRSLYTFVKRQSPPPAMLTFDAPTREKCTVRRARTNTPLQALVLLNDDTYLEAARCLAARVLSENSADEQRMQRAFRIVTSRRADDAELRILIGLLHKQRARFADDPENARKLLAVGVADEGRDGDPAEVAAWTVTLQALLNLDETVVRR